MICSAMREVANQVDKGKSGAFAVKTLLKMWRSMKLGDVTGEAISDLNAVVERMYVMMVEESRRLTEEK